MRPTSRSPSRRAERRSTRTAAARPTSVTPSIIVAAELHYGAVRKSSNRLIALVEGVLARIEVIPFSPDAERHYASLRHRLERKGTPISGNDMLIAAHALSLDATLVTANTREFARIEGLKLENWLE